MLSAATDGVTIPPTRPALAIAGSMASDATRTAARDGDVSAGCIGAPLAAVGLKTELLAEEPHPVILEAIRHLVGVIAWVDLEAVRDPVPVESIVELAGVDSCAVLVPHVDRDRAIAP